MCAQFKLKKKLLELAREIQAELPTSFSSESEDVFPHQMGLVLERGSNPASRRLNFRSYGLVPAWSKERKPKFASFNARLETLAEKPTWKSPLEQGHVLIPLTSFVESCHAGESSGHLVEFQHASGELLWAAGLCDRWRDPKTQQELLSFAMITTEPDEFIAQVGHDRSPLFLKPEHFQAWLDTNQKQDWERFLRDRLVRPALRVEKLRPLKSSASKPSSRQAAQVDTKQLGLFDH